MGFLPVQFRESASAVSKKSCLYLKHLCAMFYPELRRLAAAKMQGERSAHTWQATALVNELYLELVRIRAWVSATTVTKRSGPRVDAGFAVDGHGRLR